jgi:predicted esterase
MKYKYQIVLTVLIASVFVACGPSNTDGNTVGANLIQKAEEIANVNSSTSLGYVKAFKIDENAASAFAYKVIKIKYKTKDEQDKDVIASGVLVYPNITKEWLEGYKAKTGKNFSISLIVENHGTIFENANAPSKEITTLASSTHIKTILMTAKAGFAIAMPDYLGYGDSNDKDHPYILKKSSARVSIDMLKASTRYMIDNNILFNGQVYISGYSEGGYVAMAMAEELEKNYSSDFKLKGVAPMAGPYDLEALGVREVDATKTMEYPAFLAYVTQSYSKAYSDINLNDIIVYPDVDKFNHFFDGSLSGVAINIYMGLGDGKTTFGFKAHKADKLWKPAFINNFIDDLDNPFKVRLKENNVYDWTPKTKINMIHCEDDEIIPFSMSQTAYNKFLENGADANNITLSKIPTSILSQQIDLTHPFIHSNCGATAYGMTVKWFDQIRRGK